MKNLSTSYISQYYYVNTGVIFNIKSYDDGDPCAIYSNSISGSIPSITMSKGDEIQKLYLDVYIEDGDTYKSNVFKKTVHGEVEESVTFTEYYRRLCEKEMEKGILNNIGEDYAWFENNLSVLGIPMYMIEGQGYTVTGVSQFVFNEETLNAKKLKVAQEQVQEAAEKRADVLGYKVTNQVTLEKKS